MQSALVVKLDIAIRCDYYGTVLETGSDDVDGLRLQHMLVANIAEDNVAQYGCVTYGLTEEGMRLDPTTDVEGQQAIAAAEAEGQPVRRESAGCKNENVVHGRLVIHVELVELSNAVYGHKQKPRSKRQKN